MKFCDFLNLIGIKNLNKERFEDWNLSKRRLEIIEKIKSSEKNIVIWGASSGGKGVLKFIRDLGKEANYFVDIDKNKQGKVLEGIKIFPPSNIGENDFVLIGSIFEDEISRFLEDMNVEYVKDIIYILNFETPLFNFSILNNHLEELSAVFNLLSDKESKMVFSSYIKYILTTSPLHIQRSKYKQYFHPLVRPEKGDIIVDGGAFNGDTACEFLTYEPHIKKIYSFEPDNENFLELVHNCKDKRVVAIKKGLWSENKELTFNCGRGSGSYIGAGNKNTTKIQAVSLDSFFKDKALPDLIKLDIEGSELEALKGAREIINKKQPKLQISLYHEPLHLFKIPLFLKAINPNYKFYLGHHSGLFMELVLYAI